jgi:uncharacterized membrane protein
MFDIRVLFLLFIIYAMAGWAIEVFNCYIYQKKWVNRGFLIGPYCPIYGFGSVFITLLVPQTNDIVSTFLKSMAICSILEYLTSYMMEKLFKTRWWDYTKNKFNINGRICLETMIMFGLGGVVIVELSSPNFLFVLERIPNLALNIITGVVFVLFMIDVFVSYKIINSVKDIPRLIRKDSSEDMTSLVKQTLREKNYFYKRLVSSFPNFKSIVKKYDKKFEKNRKKLETKIIKEEKKLEKLKKQSQNLKQKKR